MLLLTVVPLTSYISLITFFCKRVASLQPLLDAVGMSHRPHDTRHTCVSLLTVAGVSDKVIKKIIGHKGQGVTEIVYTHFEIEELIDAINKI